MCPPTEADELAFLFEERCSSVVMMIVLIALLYARMDGFVLAPLQRPLCEENMFSMTSLFIMEASTRAPGCDFRILFVTN
jgi:hypothetical protein